MSEDHLPHGVVAFPVRHVSASAQAPVVPRQRVKNVVHADGCFSKKYRVLLLEPQEMLREALRSFLNTRGFDVVVPAELPADVRYIPGIATPPSCDKEKYDAVIFGDMPGVVMMDVKAQNVMAWQCAMRRYTKSLPMIVLTDNVELLAELNPARRSRISLPHVEGMLRGLFFNHNDSAITRDTRIFALLEQALYDQINRGASDQTVCRGV